MTGLTTPAWPAAVMFWLACQAFAATATPPTARADATIGTTDQRAMRRVSFITKDLYSSFGSSDGHECGCLSGSPRSFGAELGIVCRAQRRCVTGYRQGRRLPVAWA